MFSSCSIPNNQTHRHKSTPDSNQDALFQVNLPLEPIDHTLLTSLLVQFIQNLQDSLQTEIGSGGCTLTGAIIFQDLEGHTRAVTFNLGDSQTVIYSSRGEILHQTKPDTTRLRPPRGLTFFINTDISYSDDLKTRLRFIDRNIQFSNGKNKDGHYVGFGVKLSNESYKETIFEALKDRVEISIRTITGLAISAAMGDARDESLHRTPVIYTSPPLPDGFYIVCASDGLWKKVPTDSLPSLLEKTPLTEKPAEYLSKRAATKKHHDDITTVIYFDSHSKSAGATCIGVADGHGTKGKYCAEFCQIAFQRDFPGFLATRLSPGLPVGPDGLFGTPERGAVCSTGATPTTAP